MLLTILLILCTLYCLEVVWGSCSGVHNPELGFEPECADPAPISRALFWKELLPIMLGIMTVPLAFSLL